jgi:uncharacterized delta-60 repeat protein
MREENSILNRYVLLFLCAGVIYAQTERWVYRYNGAGNDEDKALVLVCGADGNIYAAGYSTGSGTGYDLTVISLTPTGDTNWTYTYNALGKGDDIANSIVYGSDDNIYVAGESDSVNTDFVVISLTNTGTERWVYRYNGPGDSEDVAMSVVRGLDGNIYAAGWSYGLGTYDDFTIIRLSAVGDEQWVYRYDGGGPYPGSEHAYALVYGADNNLYAAGYNWTWISTYRFAIFSVDTAGMHRWASNTSGTGVCFEAAFSVIYGTDHNIYAAGQSSVNKFTVRSNQADSVGTFRWIYLYGQTGAIDRAYSLVYGSDDNIYTAGHLYDAGTADDFAIVSLTNEGDSNWIYTYNGSDNGQDVAKSIVQGLDEDLYTAGWSHGLDSGDDLTILRLDTSGTEKWVYQYNGPGNGEDRGHAIVCDPDGNLYASGYSFDSMTMHDFTVISLDTTTSGVEEYSSRAESDDRFELFSTFFNEKISVRFVNDSEVSSKISLYSILGALIYETSFTVTPSLVCINDATISQLPRGIYFLLISQDGKAYAVVKLVKP